MGLPLIIKSIIYLPGTFLHELAHYATALVVGRPKGLSIFPKREGNTLVFGRVTASVRYKVLSVFISGAPLIWWVAFVFLLEKLGIVCINARSPYIHICLSTKMPGLLSFEGLFYLWLSVQLLWAGKLSIQDIKTLLGGVFSISGVVVAMFLIIIYHFFV